MSLTSPSPLPLPAVTTATFEDAVLRSTRPVLVEFTAAWCPPCRWIAPILEELAVEEAGRLTVVQLDVDQQPALARRYRVMSFPSLLLFVDGDERLRLIGAHPKRRILDELSRVIPTRVAAGRAARRAQASERPGDELADLGRGREVVGEPVLGQRERDPAGGVAEREAAAGTAHPERGR
jgi:thioredoxin 1